MPAGGIHLCVAKEVAIELDKFFSMNYMLGSVAPDSWRNSSSTKVDTHFLTDFNCYDYDCFFNKYFSYMDNDFVFGYLVHLITDMYWYDNNYVTSNYYENNCVDLKKICSNLIRIYDIPKLFLPVDLYNPISELDSRGLIYTINYLNEVNYVLGDTKVFNINDLIECIDDTSIYVVNEVNRLKNSKKYFLKK